MKSYQDILNEKSEGPSLSKIVEDFIKEYNIKGNLTIKGTTHPVDFTMNFIDKF